MTTTVLMLDDDQHFRELVRPVLENKGLRVVEAATGAEATSLVRQEEPELVIVDGNLPDTDGISWITALRADGLRTKVVFVSAAWRDQNSYYKLTNDLGVLLIVHKPIIAIVFGEQIDAVIRGEIKQLGPKQTQASKASKLNQLTAKYLTQLPTQISELRYLATTSRADGEPGSLALAEAIGWAHRINGTAGSYGLLGIGHLMKQIEEHLLSLQEPSSADSISRRQFSGNESLRLIEEALAQAKEIAILRISQMNNEWELDATNADIVKQPYLREGGATRRDDSSNQQMEAVSGVTMSKLLVVDDDEAFLDLVEELGRQRLVEVLRANTSTQALALAKEIRIDAALLDVQLGDDDISFELACQLRELPGYERLPLAFVSARAHIYNRVAAAHAGASLYLNKPLTPADLEAAFMQLISMHQNELPRVLIVDDDEDFSSRVAAVLHQEGIDVTTLNDPVRILEVLPETKPDLLILDIMMSGVSGFDLCRMLRTVPRWQNLPVVFLTAQASPESRLATFRAGGDDYLIKPCPDEELINRVMIRIERAELLKEKADKDSISGLLSRRALLEHLNAMLSAAQKLDLPVSICLLDIDRFRVVNETRGYLAGDTVISGIGLMLRRRFSLEDLRGRWGGDEFIVALHSVDHECAQGAVASFLGELDHVEFPSESSGEFAVSLSAGISTFPQDGLSAYDLIKAADRRLSSAKCAGRSLIASQD